MAVVDAVGDVMGKELSRTSEPLKNSAAKIAVQMVRTTPLLTSQKKYCRQNFIVVIFNLIGLS